MATSTVYASATAGYGFSTSNTRGPAFAPVGLAPIPVPLVTPEPTRFPTFPPTDALVPVPVPAPTVVERTEAPVTTANPTEAPVSVPDPTEAPVSSTLDPNLDPTEAPLDPTEAPVASPTNTNLDPTEAPVVVSPTNPETPVTDAPVANPIEPPEPSACDTTPPETARADGSTLVWAEEFNYEGVPQDTVWSYDLGGGGWGNHELQVYTSESQNVHVNGCALAITARQDPVGVFTSARIKTEHKVSFTYGTLEARIRPPDMDAGLWPAFWTLGSDMYQVGWPRAGEIDIMELGQGLAIQEGLVNQRVVSAAHWDLEGQYATYAKWLDAPADLTKDFHIFRMEWTPEKIATYVDDQWIWEIDITEEKCVSCQELHSPHHVMLNLAVGGGFTSGGTSSSTAAGSSSSSGSSCAGSSSSAGASSSSGGDCGARGPNDITAPLPGELLVDWIRLYDNGDTVLLETPDGLPATIPPTKLTDVEVPGVPATEVKSIPESVVPVAAAVTDAPVPVTEAPVPTTDAPVPVTDAPVPVTQAPVAPPVTQPPASVTHDMATHSPAANAANADLISRGFLRNGEGELEESAASKVLEASELAASGAPPRWANYFVVAGLSVVVILAQVA